MVQTIAFYKVQNYNLGMINSSSYIYVPCAGDIKRILMLQIKFNFKKNKLFNSSK